MTFQQSHGGERLAAILVPTSPRGGLAALSRAYSPRLPIEICYGEELTA